MSILNSGQGTSQAIKKIKNGMKSANEIRNAINTFQSMTNTMQNGSAMDRINQIKDISQVIAALVG